MNAVLEEMARDLPQEKNKNNHSTHRDLQIAANWNRGQIQAHFNQSPWSKPHKSGLGQKGGNLKKGGKGSVIVGQTC